MTTKIEKQPDFSEPTVVMMMGGGGSGKSYVADKMFPSLQKINSDDIKHEHPDYDMQGNPSDHAVHEWSSEEATRRAYEAISNRESFIFDGTGKTADKYVMMAKAAHDVGMQAVVVYVTCDLRVALERNNSRERTVDVEVLRKAHAQVPVSFEIVARYVDQVKVVDTTN